MLDNQFKAKGFLVWGVCAVFFLYEFSLRTMLGTFQHPVMQDLNLTSFEFSLLSTTVFLFVYGLMQIPVGIIVNHIGLKKSLLLGVVCCILASFGFAYADSFVMALFFRMLMGFGASFGFISLLISVNDWMPHKYIALFMGLSQFIGTLGPMLAAGPLDALSNSPAIDWRLIFLYLSFFGVFLMFLVYFFVENNQEKAGNYTVVHRNENILTSIKRLLSRSQPWLIGLLAVCLYFTLEYLSENEGRAFLTLKGVSVHSASYMITIGWIGYAIGAPLLGFLSDFFQRRRIIMQISSLMSLLAICLIIYSTNKHLLEITFFFLGVSTSGQSIGFATIAEHFKKQSVALGFGLVNAMISTFSSINAPFIGYMLDHIKTGHAPNLADYLNVFNVLIVIAAIGLIIALFFVKETFCKSTVEFTLLKKR